jgi:hypothetical protein
VRRLSFRCRDPGRDRPPRSPVRRSVVSRKLRAGHRPLNSHNTHSWQASGIPAGPSAHAGAQKAMRRLSGQVDEWRNLRTNATVDQLLDRHFELAELGVNTLAHYRSLAEKHIRSLIGSVKMGALDGDLFDSFYATLRRCRDHWANAGASTTEPTARTSATTAARPTCAGRRRTEASGTSTSFSAVRCGPCGGPGSLPTPSPRRSRLPSPSQTRSHPPQSRLHGFSGKPGRTRIGPC